MILWLGVNQAFAAIINIPIPDQVKSFMDDRNYNPSEIDTLNMGPNTNGEKTFYIDPVNGNDSFDGLSPNPVAGTNKGPFKTIYKAGGNYSGRRCGERVLIKSGYYRADMMNVANLTGNCQDENFYNTFAPYGDGEVVIDTSKTHGLDAFTQFNGNIWKSNFNANWPTGKPLYWAVMDWNFRSMRQAVGYKGTASEGTTTSLTDSTKNFQTINWNDQVHSGVITTDFVGAYIWNLTDNTSGKITATTATTLTTDIPFKSGDSYAVYIFDKDGKFATVGNTVYIRSDNGEPRTRNLIANPEDQNNGYMPNYLSGARFHFYGLTFVGSPSISVFTVGGGLKVVFEKCRFMFTGKHSYAPYGTPIPQSIKYIKNFYYANVMMAWPRGSTYGGNGGWPNAIGGGSAGYVETTGNIIMHSGGEGMGGGHKVLDNIVYDPFSVAIYPDSLAGTPTNPILIENNTILISGFRASDMLDQFYLKNSYNGSGRVFVKMHPIGIGIGAENGSGSIDPQHCKIRNNNIIGTWLGLGDIFQRSTAGWDNFEVSGNKIVLMTSSSGEIVKDHQSATGLYSSACISLRVGLEDINSKWVNNICIGGINQDNNKYFVIHRGGTNTTGNIVDNNTYYFPGNERFRKDDVVKTFSQWKTETGFDANSIMATSSPLVGTDWSDSSKIMKADLELSGNPGTPPEPEHCNEPKVCMEPNVCPPPTVCPVCPTCPTCPVCPDPIVCPPPVVCPPPIPPEPVFPCEQKQTATTFSKNLSCCYNRALAGDKYACEILHSTHKTMFNLRENHPQ